MLFSVIVVCLNAESHIAEALESVLSQGFDDYEVVVVDGGSQDRTLDIVREFEQRFAGCLRWASEPDRGLYDAMNKGLRAAQGDYVVYLGADDLMATGALEAVATSLRKDPSAQIVCGATRVFGESGEQWVERARSYAGSRVPKRTPSRHQSIYVSRDALNRANGFDTRFRIAADYDLYLRLVDAGARESLLSDVLSSFRLGGVSSRSALRTAREYRAVRVAHGAGALRETLIMWKSIAASWLHRALARRRVRAGAGR